MTTTKNNDPFFVIERDEVLAALAPATVDFYREAEYLDLTVGDLHVSTDLLRNNGKVIDNIDYEEGRKLLAKQKLSLPSPALMYNVIIPFLKEHASTDQRINHVLGRMKNEYSEFLEGIVSQEVGDRDHNLWLEMGPVEENLITKARRKISLPQKLSESDFKNYEVNGSFDLRDLDEFGFPKFLQGDGEFKYWGPQEFNQALARELGSSPQYKVVPLRVKNESLDLVLTFRPRRHFNDDVGVRGVKVE